MVHEAAGAHEEAVEVAVAVNLLDAVEEAGDYIVAAGGLAAGEDYAYVDGLGGCGVGVFFKFQLGQAVGVGEQGFDFFLVGHRLGGLAFYGLDGAGQHDGELGLIGGAGLLECTLFHELILYVFRWLFKAFAIWVQSTEKFSEFSTIRAIFS